MATAAFFAVFATPYAVEMLHCGFNKTRVIGQDSGLEIAAVSAFHAHSGSGEICRAYIGPLAINDDDFEMDAGTKHSFE